MIDVRNVRNKAEYNTMERFEHSVNIPVNDMLNGAFRLNDKEFLTKYGIYKPSVNQSIVVSGFESDISSFAAKYLRIMLGYSGIKIYYGNISDWRNADGALITSEGRWVKNVLITHGGDSEIHYGNFEIHYFIIKIRFGLIYKIYIEERSVISRVSPIIFRNH